MESLLDPLFDPLFRLPFLTGILLATLLPLLGALLVLREEWLAALGLAQLSAAGAALALALGLPALSGAALGALGGAALKAAGGAGGNRAWALMILGGWAALMLIAANSGAGAAAGQALIEGQVFFAGRADLLAALGLGLGLVLLLPWLAPRLLRARLLPALVAANAAPVRRWLLLFDLLVAAGVALATATLGVMAVFALVLVPVVLAFRRGRGWWVTVLTAALGGALSFTLAFVLALLFDQPFGPVLVAALLLAAALVHGRRAAPPG